ncbi:porin [Botryobacter ruber]|uniref:porin n=1 Tax=Botryobacter ruber TaxID=2171629 RepID=UPI000E0C3D37|nr:porin [Botryobacter ruber]
MQQLQVLAAVLLLFLARGTAAGQEHQVAEPADTAEIHSVKELFTRGKVGGHVRNYFMATRNYRSLPDNYANAVGAEISYQTAPYHGFRLGIAGLFTYNLFSSDLTQPDPVSGKLPKLELELFDIKNPENKADLDRLDELYLEYNTKWLQAKAGRFSFTSPLLNPQDGRMKPYSFQGVEVRIPLQEKALISLAWFDHFSPRSTVEWLPADEVIGLYSTGVDADGNPSGYAHHTRTSGVGVAGLQYHPGSRFSAEAWNYLIENVSNNSYGRAVVHLRPQVKVGVEGLYQFRAGNGGNPEYTQAYFPDQQQWLLGGMLAYEPADWHLSLNYLHTGKNARFLFPKELGREQFFATLPRGRMEGTGNSDLLVGKIRKQWSESFSSEAALAKSWIPSPADYQHNKYGAAAYWGWVADLHYKPAKPVLDGLSFRFLYVGRATPATDIALNRMYYNTNFHHFNFVTQLTF